MKKFLSILVLFASLLFGSCDNLNTNAPPGQPLGTPIIEDAAKSALVIEIIGGGIHLCALLANAQLKCWGDNSVGQLNLHDATNSSGKSFDVSKAQFSKVSIGTFHTCGILKGGLVDGTPVCFGRKGIWLNVPSYKVKDIACGPNFTCFLKDDGKPECIGGDINIVSKSFVATEINAKDLVKYGVDPVSKNENLDFSKRAFKSLKAGDGQICAQDTQNDMVYCMGRNANGLSESIAQKALDYASDSIMRTLIIAEDGKLKSVGAAGLGFNAIKNVSKMEALNFRKVIHSFEGNSALFTGPNNKYDDGNSMPENTLIVSGLAPHVDEDALGYASNRGGSGGSDLFAECILKKNHKIACKAYSVGGIENPNSLMVKDIPKEISAL